MQGHHVMRDSSAASYEELSEILNLARLTEYSISFLVTMIVSLVVIFKVRCQLQNFSYYIMGILMCSQMTGLTSQLLVNFKDHNMFDSIAASVFPHWLETISQCCSISIILFYTYQMQLIYDRTNQALNEAKKKAQKNTQPSIVQIIEEVEV